MARGVFQLEALEPRIMWDATGVEGVEITSLQAEVVPVPNYDQVPTEEDSDNTVAADPETQKTAEEGEEPSEPSDEGMESSTQSLDAPSEAQWKEFQQLMDSVGLTPSEFSHLYDMDVDSLDSSLSLDTRLQFGYFGLDLIVVDGVINLDEYSSFLPLPIEPSPVDPGQPPCICQTEEDIASNFACSSTRMNQIPLELLFRPPEFDLLVMTESFSVIRLSDVPSVSGEDGTLETQETTNVPAANSLSQNTSPAPSSLKITNPVVFTSPERWNPPEFPASFTGLFQSISGENVRIPEFSKYSPALLQSFLQPDAMRSQSATTPFHFSQVHRQFDPFPLVQLHLDYVLDHVLMTERDVFRVPDLSGFMFVPLGADGAMGVPPSPV